MPRRTGTARAAEGWRPSAAAGRRDRPPPPGPGSQRSQHGRLPFWPVPASSDKIRKIEYTNVDELLKDVDKLLEDEHYRHLRERNLIGSIISEEDFKNAVYDIISKNNTKYDILYKEYHVKEFLKGYVDRADYNDIAFASVAKNSNIILLNNFLDLFIKKNFYKLFKASKKIIEKLRS